MNKVTTQIIKQIPILANSKLDDLTIKRLGGLTNIVYKIGNVSGQEDKNFLLRLPGEGTESYIDREVEAYNAQQAADAGVSAEVYYFDIKSGLMLAEFLAGETMSEADFRQRAGSPARAGRVLNKLHDSGKEFKFRFELFSMIDEYLSTLSELKAELPDGYREVLKQAEPVRRTLEKHPGKLAPCHCDPLAENFIDDGEAMWMVDWEYSGMNDPLWDLGDLSVEANFTQAQDVEMLEAYCAGKVTENDQGRMVIYKAMSDLLWTLWGLIQHANKNPADDFWAYAAGRFERCQTLMAKDGFSNHFVAIK